MSGVEGREVVLGDSCGFGKERGGPLCDSVVHWIGLDWVGSRRTYDEGDMRGDLVFRNVGVFA